jgi:excisionase family DNA binding protein
MQTEPLAFNRREAADTLRISLRTLDYLLAQGEIRGRRIGRRIVIPKTEIERLLIESASGTVAIAASQTRSARNR